jgi:hypothetical protein
VVRFPLHVRDLHLRQMVQNDPAAHTASYSMAGGGKGEPVLVVGIGARLPAGRSGVRIPMNV